MATISLPNEKEELVYDENYINSDTLTVTDLEGNKINFMKAIEDEDGSMVATAELAPAVVIARFRNIAERNGEVELKFDISVPKELQDPAWQLRFSPILYVLQDTVHLEELHIVGQEYREAQIKGYEQYQKFINSIITNDDALRYRKSLELFIKRNIPAVYKYKNDSSYISNNVIEGVFGVTLDQAKEHYTNKILRRINNRKKKNINKKYAQYVRTPFIKDNIRLDTVITTSEDIIYSYTQVIKTRNMLRKVELILKGEIYEDAILLYRIPSSLPLTFYISSLSSFAEPIERYIQKIIYRKAQANTMAYIDFPKGSYKIIDSLHENKYEINRIQNNIKELLDNQNYDLDSIIVTASSSPEGNINTNAKLSKNRALAIKTYFQEYIKDYYNNKDQIILIDTSYISELGLEPNKIEFTTHTVSEDWHTLKLLIDKDSLITDHQYINKCFKINDFDKREYQLSKSKDYKYLREKLYPMLRTVRFDFHLHRKGMIKDTVNTTVIDTIYQRGLNALKERNYKKAIELLRPYQDINTAVAYLSMNYTSSALAILEKENKGNNAKMEYMLALVYSKEREYKLAVQHLIRSIQLDRSMLFRGNLDPEISAIIKKYNIDTHNSIY